jgi:hypothetical protein
MKKGRRKLLSVQRRDLWDGPNQYDFWNVPSNELKYMLEHKSKKDGRIKSEIMLILRLRRHLKLK